MFYNRKYKILQKNFCYNKTKQYFWLTKLLVCQLIYKLLLQLSDNHSNIVVSGKNNE